MWELIVAARRERCHLSPGRSGASGLFPRGAVRRWRGYLSARWDRMKHLSLLRTMNADITNGLHAAPASQAKIGRGGETCGGVGDRVVLRSSVGCFLASSFREGSVTSCQKLVLGGQADVKIGMRAGARLPVYDRAVPRRRRVVTFVVAAVAAGLQ